MRLLAILAVRDDARFLPGYVANVAPHVDGIIALDDRSTDGSVDLLERSPAMLEPLHIPGDRPDWDELANYRRLVLAALAHHAEWIVLLDADERVERQFRHRAENVIERGRLLGIHAFSLRVHELWDRPNTVRVDGIWGRKSSPRLFRARADHDFGEQPLHGRRPPLQARWLGRFPLADLRLYHLRMVHPGDRETRRARYERLDPEMRWQPGIGYAYLTDEDGLRLEPVPADRGYVD